MLASGLITWLYADVVRSLALDWWNLPGASYGFAIPPIAAWLAWARRGCLAAQPAVPDGRGLALVLVACLALLAGSLSAGFFIARISLVGLLAGLAWTFWGLARLRILTAPLVMLVTMIPIPVLLYNRIAIPLQLLASHVATEVVRLAGGTIYRDGNILHLPGLTLGIAESCSGLHSLTAVVVVALLMGLSHCQKATSRLLLVLLAIPLAIGVNVVRVAGTVALALTSEQLAMGFYHSFSGWLVFLGCSGLVFLLARRLHWLLER